MSGLSQPDDPSTHLRPERPASLPEVTFEGVPFKIRSMCGPISIRRVSANEVEVRSASAGDDAPEPCVICERVKDSIRPICDPCYESHGKQCNECYGRIPDDETAYCHSCWASLEDEKNDLLDEVEKKG